MQDAILSIDEGTTGVKALVIDRNGQTIGSAYAEFEQIFPQPGWVEHNAETIWHTTETVIQAALKDATLTSEAIQAIGITNQRETTVLWDKETGKPVGTAIVWQCRRTAPRCKELQDSGLSDKFRDKTGLVIDAYFSGTKIEWLIKNRPEAQELADKGNLAFGTMDTWLIYKLTGQHVTEYTNASRTLIYNIYEKKWDEELLNILGIPKDILPKVKPSSGTFGKTNGLSFLHDGIPIAGDAGDQQAALFGQGAIKVGQAKNTYGTGSFVLMNTGDKGIRSKHGLLTTLACSGQEKPVYALEGSIFITGAGIQWLRDSLQVLKSAPESEIFARSVEDTGGVYFVPAFVGLGAPYWDADARAAILGLTRGSSKEHIIRAMLESMAYQTREVIEAMTQDSGIVLEELRVDGGATTNRWLLQFQADILNIPVVKTNIPETTAYGAALLAGLGVGFYDLERLSDVVQIEEVFEPSISDDARETLWQGWKDAVQRVLTK